MALSLHPYIVTPRLIIRSPRYEDAASLSRLNSNPSATRFEPPRPRKTSIEDYRDRIPNWDGMRHRGEAAFMIIVKRRHITKFDETNSHSFSSASKERTEEDEDEAIGMSGINAITTKGSERIADLGVMIDSSEWRKGYASEALTAVFDYTFDQGECDVVEMTTMCINEPFQALVAHLGLDASKRLAESGTEVEYRVTKAQWQDSKRVSNR